MLAVATQGLSFVVMVRVGGPRERVSVCVDVWATLCVSAGSSCSPHPDSSPKTDQSSVPSERRGDAVRRGDAAPASPAGPPGESRPSPDINTEGGSGRGLPLTHRLELCTDSIISTPANLTP